MRQASRPELARGAALAVERQASGMSRAASLGVADEYLRRRGLRVSDSQHEELLNAVYDRGGARQRLGVL